jgi:hypothetical protein
LIFEYYRVAFEESFPDMEGELHVFISNIDGTDLTPVTNGLKSLNFIQNISADGQMALVSSLSNYTAKGDLYLVYLNLPGSDPIKLASGLTGRRQAIFLDNAHIVYISQGREGYGFYTANFNGTNPKKIGAPVGKAWGIISSDKTRVYWDTYQNKKFRDNSGVLYRYGDIKNSMVDKH